MILPVTLVAGPLDGQELLYAEPLPASIIAVNDSGTVHATYARRGKTLFYDLLTPHTSRNTSTPPPHSKGTPSP